MRFAHEPMKTDYEALAADYAANRSIHPLVFHHLVEAIQAFPDARVLEIGCGTGNYIGALAAGDGRGVLGRSSQRRPCWRWPGRAGLR